MEGNTSQCSTDFIQLKSTPHRGKPAPADHGTGSDCLSHTPSSLPPVGLTAALPYCQDAVLGLCMTDSNSSLSPTTPLPACPCHHHCPPFLPGPQSISSWCSPLSEVVVFVWCLSPVSCPLREWKDFVLLAPNPQV